MVHRAQLTCLSPSRLRTTYLTSKYSNAAKAAASAGAMTRPARTAAMPWTSCQQMKGGGAARVFVTDLRVVPSPAASAGISLAPRRLQRITHAGARMPPTAIPTPVTAETIEYVVETGLQQNFESACSSKLGTEATVAHHDMRVASINQEAEQTIATVNASRPTPGSLRKMARGTMPFLMVPDTRAPAQNVSYFSCADFEASQHYRLSLRPRIRRWQLPRRLATF